MFEYTERSIYGKNSEASLMTSHSGYIALKCQWSVHIFYKMYFSVQISYFFITLSISDEADFNKLKRSHRQ